MVSRSGLAALAIAGAIAWTLAGQGLAGQESAAPAAASPSPKESAADKEVADNLEKARRTLKYGIDTMVVSVINQAMANKDKRLSGDIVIGLSSINPEVQKASVDYYIALEDYSIRAKVIELLVIFNELDETVVIRLLKFIQNAQKPAEPELLEALLSMCQSSKADIQAAAVDALSTSGGPDQVEGLIKLFKKTGTPSQVRAAIVRIMGKYSTADTTKLLKDIVTDPGEEKSLRYEALTALGKQGQAENLKLITPSLTAKDVFERGAAINALAGFPIATVLPYYQQALRDGMWRNRMGVLKLIAEKKLNQLEEAVIFVAEDDPEKPVRIEAIRTLGVLNGAASWAMMERRFKDPKTGDEVRGSMAELMIGKHFAGSREVLKTVFQEEFLKEKSWLLDVMCRELANLKDASAAEFYDKMLGHKNFVIQIYGVRGIKENALLSFRPRLEEMLKAKPVSGLKASIEDALK